MIQMPGNAFFSLVTTLEPRIFLRSCVVSSQFLSFWIRQPIFLLDWCWCSRSTWEDLVSDVSQRHEWLLQQTVDFRRPEYLSLLTSLHPLKLVPFSCLCFLSWPPTSSDVASTLSTSCQFFSRLQGLSPWFSGLPSCWTGGRMVIIVCTQNVCCYKDVDELRVS